MLNLSPLSSLIGAVASIVGSLVPILVTLGLVVFLWGLVRYLWSKGGKADIENAKNLMKWGLVTLFVMVSVWGIIDLMQSALNINKNAEGRAPRIIYPGSGGYNSVNDTYSGYNTVDYKGSPGDAGKQ